MVLEAPLESTEAVVKVVDLLTDVELEDLRIFLDVVLPVLEFVLDSLYVVVNTVLDDLLAVMNVVLKAGPVPLRPSMTMSGPLLDKAGCTKLQTLMLHLSS